MAKRHAVESSSTKKTRIASSDSLKALEGQVIAIAEQLGRIAGAAEARANGWLNQPAFQTKLARIRKRASQLLSRLSADGAAADDRQARARAQSRAKVAAPGKKHRKAPKPPAAVEASHELTARAIATRRQKVRPRQG